MDELKFYTDLNNFRQYALAFARRHLDNRSVNLSININPKMSSVTIDIVSRENLEMLFK
jgi:hypothetical protein